MGKLIPDKVLDNILNDIANCTKLHITSDTDTPLNLNNSLAVADLTPSDFTIEEGDSGIGSRKITIASKTDIEITADGTPQHVVLTLDSGEFKLITTCLGPDFTVGSKADTPQFKYELSKPI